MIRKIYSGGALAACAVFLGLLVRAPLLGAEHSLVSCAWPSALGPAQVYFPERPQSAPTVAARLRRAHAETGVILGDNGFRGLFKEWTALFANPRWVAAAFHAQLQPLAWFHVLTVVRLGVGQVLGAGLLLRAACWCPAVLVDGALQAVPLLCAPRAALFHRC